MILCSLFNSSDLFQKLILLKVLLFTSLIQFDAFWSRGWGSGDDFKEGIS